MLPQILLERKEGRSLYEQLTTELRRLILSGWLAPGTRLPPSREAARELKVSRTVVVEAYEQLRLEGYLESRVGVGTWVSRSLPPHLLQPEGSEEDARRPRTAPGLRLSRRGERLVREWPDARFTRSHGPFRPGGVAVEHFPNRLWGRLSSKVWRSRAHELVSYGDAAGYGPLREAIAEHVIRYRAVRCEPRQIVVTAGSQQALDLVARLMIDPGDEVAVEDPGYSGARAAFANAGAKLVPAPVDAEGMIVPGSNLEGARLVYTTPSHQYPLGVTMSLERRLRLLEWADRSGAWIVEDDYDSEFRYEGRPLPSLQGLDEVGRVIYAGTFSKVLAPGLRLGFLVLPEHLVEPSKGARLVMDQHVTTSVQATLAELISEGHLERHIARMRSVYDERRQALRAAVEELLPGRAEIVSGSAGLHMTLMLLPGVDDVAVADRALARSIQAPPLSTQFLGDSPAPGLVLGFGGAPPERLRAGVEVLRDAIEEAGV